MNLDLSLGGVYDLTATSPRGTRILGTAINKVTDDGLRNIGARLVVSHCQIGGLEAAASGTGPSGGSIPDGKSFMTYLYTFAAPGVDTQLTSMAVGWKAPGFTAFSRATLPAPVLLLADETLTVSYRLTVTVDTALKAGTNYKENPWLFLDKFGFDLPFPAVEYTWSGTSTTDDNHSFTLPADGRWDAAPDGAFYIKKAYPDTFSYQVKPYLPVDSAFTDASLLAQKLTTGDAFGSVPVDLWVYTGTSVLGNTSTDPVSDGKVYSADIFGGKNPRMVNTRVGPVVAKPAIKKFYREVHLTITPNFPMFTDFTAIGAEILPGLFIKVKSPDIVRTAFSSYNLIFRLYLGAA